MHASMCRENVLEIGSALLSVNFLKICTGKPDQVNKCYSESPDSKVADTNFCQVLIIE